MNRTQAMAKINPQAVEITDQCGSVTKMARCASYDEALGFESSCHGVSSLAHYSLLAEASDTVSRKSCAREIKKTLQSFISLDLLEAMVEVFVNRHDEECRMALIRVPDDVYRLLSEWETEWQYKLGAVDKE